MNEASEYKAILIALWERGEEFPWHFYHPSFDEFLRELKEWMAERP